MWEVIKDLSLVAVGAGIGIVMMCVIQVGKEADRTIEEMKNWRNEK